MEICQMSDEATHKTRAALVYLVSVLYVGNNLVRASVQRVVLPR